MTLQSIADGVIATDAEGRVSLLNPVAEVLTGWTDAEALGLPLEGVFQLLDESTRQSVESPAARVLSTGRTVEPRTHFASGYSTNLVSRDGTERPIDASAAAIQDEKGNVVGVVLVFRDVSDRKRVEQTARFLADVSAALAEPANYETILQRIAALAVPHFADWCTVDMLQPDGALKRLAVQHTDPAKVQLAQEVYRKYPPRPDDQRSVPLVLRTGKPDWATIIPDSVLAESTHNEEHLRLMRELGLKSYLCVPLRSRTGLLGALTFVMAESGRVYQADDLQVAEDLAGRAVIAIENATLLESLKDADRRKDEFLATLAHELRNPLAPIRNCLQVLKMSRLDASTAERTREMMERQAATPGPPG